MGSSLSLSRHRINIQACIADAVHLSQVDSGGSVSVKAG